MCKFVGEDVRLSTCFGPKLSFESPSWKLVPRWLWEKLAKSLPEIWQSPGLPSFVYSRYPCPSTLSWPKESETHAGDAGQAGMACKKWMPQGLSPNSCSCDQVAPTNSPRCQGPIRWWKWQMPPQEQERTTCLRACQDADGMNKLCINLTFSCDTPMIWMHQSCWHIFDVDVIVNHERAESILL